MTLNTRSFRDTLGLFVTGVTIVTTRSAEDEKIGVTANSFNSVSMEPPLILWSLSNHSRSLKAFERAGYFAVHILRRDQEALSNLFASRGKDKFGQLITHDGIGKVPLLRDYAACLQCRTYNQYQSGDHVIFIGEVLEISSDPSAEPLLFHGGRYAGLAN